MTYLELRLKEEFRHPQAKSYSILIPHPVFLPFCEPHFTLGINEFNVFWPAAGFMSREERKKFEGLHSAYNKYWIPCVWFTNLAAVARCEGRIKDDHTLKLLLEVQHYTHTHTHHYTGPLMTWNYRSCVLTETQFEMYMHTHTKTEESEYML